MTSEQRKTMGNYNQMTVPLRDIADILNSLTAKGKDICWVIPWYGCDGNLVAIVYKE